MTDTAASSPLPDGQALAALVAGKLCHDFISPAGAISSGLDLLKDPTAQDMRDDAMGLIEASAKKMVALVAFARVAFGASTSAERFSGAELGELVSGLLAGGRATLDWRVEGGDYSKAQARALVNLAYLTAAALPSGGAAAISTERGDGLRIYGVAEGPRARIKPEAVAGLAGRPLAEGLPGQWIQPYWLWLTAQDAGGSLAVRTEEGRVALTVHMPN
ncbi:histidine phosphotransferase family protein [Roseibacterium beibuensis]|uniref:histidine phosphotransferase ChpT n=1 Tax=[Roseibacterium] beibuensis TaxID=1193142 RepID=UPI00217E3A29|nr:histidine phosphotransferase family protein [Roseibacterium beibuensis]MCS6627305.1 histidine phosphotransferase family protein [Roseibacterium beibuensis]